MPAAAVIPALIAYIKVVAVKKLVVGFWCSTNGLLRFVLFVGASFLGNSLLLTEGCCNADRLL